MLAGNDNSFADPTGGGAHLDSVFILKDCLLVVRHKADIPMAVFSQSGVTSQLS